MLLASGGLGFNETSLCHGTPSNDEKYSALPPGERPTASTILSRLCIIKFRRTGPPNAGKQRSESELILLTIPNGFSIFPGNPLNRFRLILQEGML